MSKNLLVISFVFIFWCLIKPQIANTSPDCADLSRRNPNAVIQCGGEQWLDGRILPNQHAPAYGTARNVSQSGSSELSWQEVALMSYVLISGLLGLVIIRPPLINWYKSGSWFIWGSGPVDILFRQIGFRLGFEFFIFAVACIVGSLGGNLAALFKLLSKKD